MLLRSSLARVLSAALLLVGSLACATGTPPEEGDGGGGTGGGTGASGGQTGLVDYAYRRPLDISDTVVAGYSLAVTVDHASLVTEAKAREDGQDLRVAVDTAAGLVELDRVLDPSSAFGQPKTVLWFRTPADDPTGSYYLYYGNAKAGSPPADASKVYEAWDGFDSGPLDEELWALAEIGGATGTAMVAGGSLRVSGATGDIGSSADSCVLAYRQQTGDFVADAEIAAVGGSLGAVAKMGGLMIRQGDAEDSAYMMMTIQQLPRARLSGVRKSAGASATDTQLPVAEQFPQLVRIQRLGSELTTFYSDDGNSWVGLGGSENLGLTDPVMLGVPFANISGGSGSVDTDWIRIRKRVSPEPTVQLGAEEAI
jgi:hypothetical protein